MYKYLTGGNEEERATLLSRAHWQEAMVTNLKKEEIQSEHKKTLFKNKQTKKTSPIVKVIKNWSRLPREVMKSLPVEMLKTWLDIGPGQPAAADPVEAGCLD